MSITAPCFADESISIETELLTPAQIQEINRLENLLPEGSTISYANGSFHIYSPDIADVYEALGMELPDANVQGTSVTAPEGGTFTNFGAAPAAGMSWPLYQIYLPADRVQALMLDLSAPGLAPFIRPYIATGASLATLKSIIAANFPKINASALTMPVLTILVNWLCYEMSYLEYRSLELAESNSSTGKVCVIEMYSATGSLYTVYASWNSNVCTSEFGVDATFSRGNYDAVLD